MSKEIKTINTQTNLEKLLVGYNKMKVSNYKKIAPGDRIRYFVDKEFRYGGTVKLNKFPDYLVLINPRLKKTWCLQFKQPKLIVYHQSLKKVQNENKIKNELYKKYINGELEKK